MTFYSHKLLYLFHNKIDLIEAPKTKSTLLSVSYDYNVFIRCTNFRCSVLKLFPFCKANSRYWLCKIFVLFLG